MMIAIRKKIQFLLIPALFAITGNTQAQSKPNVLFIIADDLRPTLGCYDDSFAITPNIDRLAGAGTVFLNTYCQEAVCNPSRTSFMTGHRPNTTKVFDLETHFRKTLPKTITLPELFKKQGYHVQSVGKIYHDPAALQDPKSWSVPETFAVTTNLGKYVLDSNLHRKGGWKSTATERTDKPEMEYIDGMVSDAAIRVLDSIKGKPFFLAVGFRRPHLPFSAPEKYWQLYDGRPLPLPVNTHAAINAFPPALQNGPELKGYIDIPDSGNIPVSKIQNLVLGYYACTSFMDAQVGKVLKELDKLGLAGNTIIVFLGDNGYHLGEETLWCKATNFEVATKVPLIISWPGQKQTGTVTKALVELVDVYPTVSALAKLKAPTDLEGTSLIPLLNDPSGVGKKAAFSQFPRPWPYKGQPTLMGYSIRTGQFRYTEWKNFKTGKTAAKELYDHSIDPLETENRVDEKSYTKRVSQLHQLLNNGPQKMNP